MEYTYRQILKKLNVSDACMKYTAEGMNISPLYPGKKDGTVCDCFISYEGNTVPTAACVAIRWNCEQDAVLECTDAGMLDTGTDEEVTGAGNYMELYPQVRTFAFSDTLTEDQKDILKKFDSALKSCCRSGMREKMNMFFQEFYIWCQPFLAE